MAGVTVTRHGRVGLVTFDRPDRHNAWTEAMGEAYFAALREFDRDPGIRVAVVTGAGRSFCVGGDAEDLQRLADGHQAESPRTPQWATKALDLPVVAAIDGGCAGIGFVQAMMCDVRFASSTARFSTAYSRRGLPAEHGISWMLPRLVGLAHATELLLSARTFDAAEALRMGLISEVVDGNVLELAMAWATDVAANCSPSACAAIKGQLRGDANRGLAQSADEAELLVIQHIAEQDFAEGVASLTSGHPPQFGSLPPRQ